MPQIQRPIFPAGSSLITQELSFELRDEGASAFFTPEPPRQGAKLSPALLIGWAAMWRPMALYLYRWWPVLRPAWSGWIGQVEVKSSL